MTRSRGLTDYLTDHPDSVIDDVRDYLSAVTADLGVGLESCCWGSEAPAWAYVALDWRLGGRDVALVWDEKDGWSAATEAAGVGADLTVVAHLDGEIVPPPATVAQFVAMLQAELPWAQPLPAAG
jgi:hypothetical protein